MIKCLKNHHHGISIYIMCHQVLGISPRSALISIQHINRKSFMCHLNHFNKLETNMLHKLVPDDTVNLSSIFYWLIFILFYPNLRLRELIFPWYLLHTFNFVHTLWYLFFSLFRIQFLLTSKSRTTYLSGA